jgi:hypothetical protein
MGANFQGLVPAMDALWNAVSADPTLDWLHPTVAELKQQAGHLAAGAASVPELGVALHRERGVSRAQAVLIVEAVATLPRASDILAGATDAERLLFARFLGNLVDGVTARIMRDYPDLMRT